MNRHIKNVIKVSAFVILFAVIFAVCNFIAQPVWTSDSQYDRIYGFYDEPQNTIETVFLGSSHMAYGVSPSELYKDYGICSYNLGMPSQPMLASYYWLQEAFRLHQQTLDTVVLDVEMLKKNVSSSWYQMAIDSLQFSPVKIRAMNAYSSNFTEFLQNMIPLLSYHDRWKDLNDEDFLKYSYEPLQCIRGQYIPMAQWINDENNFSNIDTPLLTVEKSEDNTELEESEIDYLKKIISFCEQHELKLVLIKTPAVWTSEDHNAVQELADMYNLEFMDFNLNPYYNDIQFNIATDMPKPGDTTNIHLNYYGAVKLTNYLGQYLIENCENQDVRNNETYLFMDKELSEYQRYVSFQQSLLTETDPCNYIEEALNAGDFTIFISVKDDASESLTEKQRDYFKSVGLTYLSQISYGSSYLAVIDNGDVITEQYQKDPGTENATNDILNYSGTLHNGTSYIIKSGGYHMGNESSIVINGTECSTNKRGLNIAVYDNKMQQYIGNAYFDTNASPERASLFNEQNYELLLEEGVAFSGLTGKNRVFYLYNRECGIKETAKLARQEMMDANDLPAYLENFLGVKDIDIYITVKGDASNILTNDIRFSLSNLGLVKLSELTYGNSYIAVISNGNILTEECGTSGKMLEETTNHYMLTSAGGTLDGSSSVIINGTDYFEGENGIQVTIYDHVTELVEDILTIKAELGTSEEEAAG